jgi:V8-like Glu-specific endopeptidase
MKYKILIPALISSALSFASIDAAFAQTSGLPSPIDGQPTNDQPAVTNFDLGFGDDNRVPMRSSAYPWSAVGRVQIDGAGHCTGALIGRDLVLTNAHCIWIDGQRRDITFAPNYKNGQSSETARGIHYWWGTDNPSQNRRADWAIIRLERSIGDRYGWFGIQSLNYQDLQGRKVTYAGYSTFGDEKRQEFIGGQTAQVHIGCQIRDVYPNNGVIHTDCDNGRGGSGGPIFIWQNNKPIIVGINAAEFRGDSNTSFFTQNYTPGQGNVGVPTLEFAQTLEEVNRPLLIPLALYWNGQIRDNATVASLTMRRSQEQSGYAGPNIQGCVFSTQQPDTVPLYLFWHQQIQDNATVATPEMIQSQISSGYGQPAIQGYIYPTQQPDTVPLYLFWHQQIQDNATVATPEMIQSQISSGYGQPAIQGYIYPADKCSQ